MRLLRRAMYNSVLEKSKEQVMWRVSANERFYIQGRTWTQVSFRLEQFQYMTDFHDDQS